MKGEAKKKIYRFDTVHSVSYLASVVFIATSIFSMGMRVSIATEASFPEILLVIFMFGGILAYWVFIQLAIYAKLFMELKDK
jgi:hypothetical protein